MLDCHLEHDYDYSDFHMSDEEEKLLEVADFFEEVLKQCYGKSAFKTDIFEHCLEEIANILNIRFYSNNLQVGSVNV